MGVGAGVSPRSVILALIVFLLGRDMRNEMQLYRVHHGPNNTVDDGGRSPWSRKIRSVSILPCQGWLLDSVPGETRASGLAGRRQKALSRSTNSLIGRPDRSDGVEDREILGIHHDPSPIRLFSDYEFPL